MAEYIDMTFFEAYVRTEYDGTTTPTDTVVQEYIDLAQQQVEEKTGRTWDLKTNVNEMYDKPFNEIYLKNYPVLNVSEIRNKEGTALTYGIDDDYIIEGDFVVFNPLKSNPDRVFVDYTSGYTTVRAEAKWLTVLYTVQKLSQSASTTDSNSRRITVGPISLDKTLGMNTIVNLELDIKTYERALRRLVRGFSR